MKLGDKIYWVTRTFRHAGSSPRPYCSGIHICEGEIVSLEGLQATIKVAICSGASSNIQIALDEIFPSKLLAERAASYYVAGDYADELRQEYERQDAMSIAGQ